MSDNESLPEKVSAQSGVVLLFADELPEHCPPADASPAEGKFYSTHRSSPPDAMDFQTAAQRGVFLGADECKRRGNSVMASIADARQLCRAYPDVYLFVSEGILSASSGMLKIDGTKRYPSHHTLWRFVGVTMHSIFARIV